MKKRRHLAPKKSTPATVTSTSPKALTPGEITEKLCIFVELWKDAFISASVAMIATMEYLREAKVIPARVLEEGDTTEYLYHVQEWDLLGELMRQPGDTIEFMPRVPIPEGALFGDGSPVRAAYILPVGMIDMIPNANMYELAKPCIIRFGDNFAIFGTHGPMTDPSLVQRLIDTALTTDGWGSHEVDDLVGSGEYADYPHFEFWVLDDVPPPLGL